MNAKFRTVLTACVGMLLFAGCQDRDASTSPGITPATPRASLASGTPRTSPALLPAAPTPPPTPGDKTIVPPQSEIEGKVPSSESEKERDDGRKAAEAGNDAQYRPEIDRQAP